MSTQTQTIRVRILPGVRMWQALIVAAAIVLSLLLGVLIGRSDAPAIAESTIGSKDFSRYACTGHVPNPACQTVEVGFVSTGHVPPGGFSTGDHDH
ncbi:MAG TPA: hypothetical protein VGZ51_02520 [Actinomycetota bacterium]|nr:hypothetical protein [Actinomycetota bacterium]